MGRVLTTRGPLSVRPLTPERWPDLERLFGARGACGGCWCMWWRLRRSEFQQRKGGANKRAFRRIVEKNATPGILAYEGREPIGWCAIEPREHYAALARSRTLKPVDDRPVWSVTCFFIARSARRQGLSVKLLTAALMHAGRHGARIVEGYPVEPRKDAMPDAFAWTGFAAAFRQAGFREVARRSATRPIMRIELR
jgi:GNAT superfamily N-acetyltransferase